MYTDLGFFWKVYLIRNLFKVGKAVCSHFLLKISLLAF